MLHSCSMLHPVLHSMGDDPTIFEELYAPPANKPYEVPCVEHEDADDVEESSCRVLRCGEDGIISGWFLQPIKMVILGMVYEIGFTGLPHLGTWKASIRWTSIQTYPDIQM